MKKIVLALAFGLAVLGIEAQPFVTHVRHDGHHLNRIQALEQMATQGKAYRLTRMYTDDYYDIQHYTYDAQDRILAVSDSLNAESGSYFVIDSMHYNDKGQLVRLAGWQYFDGVPRNVYYVDYTYDRHGDLATRTNYNYYNDGWGLGGVYRYTYNDNHQILTSELTIGGRVIQRVEWTYQDGKPVKELWSGYDYITQGLIPNLSMTFRYNDRGEQISRDDSVSDDGTLWEYDAHRIYRYDDRGNCILYEYYDYTGGIAERSEYFYDFGILMSDVAMPIHPELERPNTYNNVNALSTEAWWTVDIEHNLQYVCDYLYEYNGAPVGISDNSQQPFTVSPNPANGRVIVEGLGDAPVRVLLFDAAGRQVLSAHLSAASNTIDVSPLVPGIYILNAAGRTAKLLVK